MSKKSITTPRAARNTRRATLTPDALRKLSPTVRALIAEQNSDDSRTRFSRAKGLVSIDEAHDSAGEALAVREERAHVAKGYELSERGALSKVGRDRWETDLPTGQERAALAELLRALRALVKADAWEPREKEAIGAAYVAIFGHAPGERWKDELRRTLEWQIELRREDALRRANGLPRRGPAPGAKRWTDPLLSPSEIVALVRRHASDTPPELTAREVEHALEVCSLGRGGGRGKRGTMTVGRWTEDFDRRSKTTDSIVPKSLKRKKKKRIR